MNARIGIGMLIVIFSANVYTQTTTRPRGSGAQKANVENPSRLGAAETVTGGELILVEETCTFNGLGTGYALYVTNVRGTAIGKGCALPDALPPELGLMMVQWGVSQVRGSETYRVDDFTWTARGRIVLAAVLEARKSR